MNNCVVCEVEINPNRKYCSRKCVSKNQFNKEYRNQYKRGMLRKLDLLKLKGNKCQKCSYSKSTRALSFHHRDPKEKSFPLDIRHCSNRSWERLLKELEKCDLLCLNCHAETEADIIGFPHLLEELEKENTMVHEKKEKPEPKKKKVKKIRIPKPILYCKQCNTEFKQRDGGGVYCSLQCATLGNRKAERPSKEDLTKLLDRFPMTTIAKQFGVTGNAVKKWVKSYQIEIPEHRRRGGNKFSKKVRPSGNAPAGICYEQIPQTFEDRPQSVDTN